MNILAPLTAPDLLQAGRWFSARRSLVRDHRLEPQGAAPASKARLAETGTMHVFTLPELFAPTPPTRFAATRQELEAETTPETAPLTGSAAALALPVHLLSRADHIIQTVEAVQAQMEVIGRRRQIAGEPLARGPRSPARPARPCRRLSRSAVTTSTGTCTRRSRATVRSSPQRSTAAPTARRTSTPTRSTSSTPSSGASTAATHPCGSRRCTTSHKKYGSTTGIGGSDAQGTGVANAEELVERLLDVRKPIDALLAEPAGVQHLVQIKLPSRSWFYGYAGWFNGQPGDGCQAYMTRHGRSDWEANFLLFDRFVQTATLPLQYVFADHYKLDVLHVDDAYREALGRLWLTLLIDAYSRAVLGLFLAYEGPNIESIQGALRHAIWPKTGLSALGIDLPWSCYGIPQRLVSRQCLGAPELLARRPGAHARRRRPLHPDGTGLSPALPGALRRPG